MAVEYLKTHEDYKEALKANPKVAIDFTAKWCGPCKSIGPKFDAMAGQYLHIKFFKVDVDDNPDTAEECNIEAMPTFKFYHDGNEVSGMTGADEKKLKENMDALASR